MSKYKGKKTNNASADAKATMRDDVMRLVVGDKSVLEVFCGAGGMYNKVWNRADFYTGIDKVKYFDERNTICGDALKAVKKIELNPYNIFDIDSYGSPYEILDCILSKINLDRDIAFILTDGSCMDLKMGRISKGLRSILGIKCHIAKKAHFIHKELIHMVATETCSRLGGTLDCFRIASGVTGSQMQYVSFICRFSDAA